MWCLAVMAALLVEPACSKGGYSSSYSSYGRSGSSYRTAAMYGAGGAAVGAYAAVVLTSSGSRRRYGTYERGYDGSCRVASEKIITASCTNLIGNETDCWKCIDCTTSYCQEAIPNCQQFLSEMYTECCEDPYTGCDGTNGEIESGAIVAGVLFGILVPLCCCAAYIMKQKQEREQLAEEEFEIGVPPPVHSGDVFAVQVPPGAGPGMTLLINSPQGQQMNVVVPPGVLPGQTFQVQCPAQAHVPAITLGQPVRRYSKDSE
eukprot:TRINITY_DN6548_c0_g1_i2.p1 TRINITY_DN6548_c0_g1~~TRINITY_DN6548_c0_g1_i2.p1  ORF type:complete len:261 (-),score=34.55 TRINITY_DN6548_c0_g1_i2:63-845(-)